MAGKDATENAQRVFLAKMVCSTHTSCAHRAKVKFRAYYIIALCDCTYASSKSSVECNNR